MISIPYISNGILGNKGKPLSGLCAGTKNPYRAHNTDYWGSTGCITAQTGNPEGDFSTVINALNSWGITDNFDIPCSFGLGVK